MPVRAFSTGHALLLTLLLAGMAKQENHGEIASRNMQEGWRCAGQAVQGWNLVMQEDNVELFSRDGSRCISMEAGMFRAEQKRAWVVSEEGNLHAVQVARRDMSLNQQSNERCFPRPGH